MIKKMLKSMVVVLLVAGVIGTILPMQSLVTFLADARAEETIAGTERVYAPYLDEAESNLAEWGPQTSGEWQYVIAGGYAVITGHTDQGQKSLAVPDMLGGTDVIGLLDNVFAGHDALETVQLHGNIYAMRSRAIPRGITLQGYHGSYALWWAAENGYSFEDRSSYEFAEGVVDFEGIRRENFERISQYEIRIRDLEAERVQSGTVFFLLDPQDRYQVSYYRAVSVSEPDNNYFVTIQCETPTLEEVLIHASATDEVMYIDPDSIQTEDGVSLSSSQSTKSPKLYYDAITADGEASFGLNELTFSFMELELDDKQTISGEAKFSQSYSVSYDIGELSDDEFSVTQSQKFDVSIKYEDEEIDEKPGKAWDEIEMEDMDLVDFMKIWKEETNEDIYTFNNKDFDDDYKWWKLGKLTIWSAGGFISIDLGIYFCWSVTGELSVTYSTTTETTFTYKNGSVVSKNVEDRNHDINVNGEISGKIGLTIELNVKIFAVNILSLDLFIGAKASLSMALEYTSDGTLLANIRNAINMVDCLDFEVTLGIELEIYILKNEISEHIKFDGILAASLNLDLMQEDFHIHTFPCVLKYIETDGKVEVTLQNKDTFHLADNCPYDSHTVEFVTIKPDGTLTTLKTETDYQVNDWVSADSFPELTDNKGLIEGYRFDGWYILNTEDPTYKLPVPIPWESKMTRLEGASGFVLTRDTTVYARLVPVSTVHVCYPVSGEDKYTYEDILIDKNYTVDGTSCGGNYFSVEGSGIFTRSESDATDVTRHAFRKTPDISGWIMVEDFTGCKEVTRAEGEAEDITQTWTSTDQDEYYVLGISGDSILVSFYGNDDADTQYTAIAGFSMDDDVSVVSLPENVTGLQKAKHLPGGWCTIDGTEVALPITVGTYEENGWYDANGKFYAFTSQGKMAIKKIILIQKWTYDQTQQVVPEYVSQIVGEDFSIGLTPQGADSDYIYSSRNDTNHTVTISGFNRTRTSYNSETQQNETYIVEPQYLVIPSTVSLLNSATGCYEDYTVTSVSAAVFNYSTIKAVRFASGCALTSLPSLAGCTNLEHVDLMYCDKVTSLPASMFKNLTKLQCVLLPGSVKDIGSECFYGCISLSYAKLNCNIGSYAFCRCTALAEAELGLGVSKIDKYAFANCTDLTEFTVPENVISLGDYFLSGAVNVTVLKMNGMVSVLTKNMMNLGEGSRLNELELGDGVTQLGDYALSNGGNGFAYLKTLVLPNNITSFGSSCFAGLQVTSLTIGSTNAFTQIGSSAFLDCTMLEEVTINGGSIGGSALASLPNLKRVKLGKLVTKIGDSAFSGCTALESVDMSECEILTSVGSSAFENCSSLTELVFPDSVTYYGGYCIYGCTSLTDLTIGYAGTEAFGRRLSTRF